MWKPRSLAGRVALSVAFGSLLSGTIVAIVTGMLSRRLIRVHEDSHLRDAAGTLAFELRVKGYEPSYAAWDETRELAHTGIVVAIFEQGSYVAGDTSIPYVAPNACVDSAQTRACGVAAERRVTVAARAQALTSDQSDITTRSAVIAVLLTSLLSTGVALLLAHAAVKPLGQLARAVQSVPEHAPDNANLGPNTGVREVDALRETLNSAFTRLGRALTQSRNFAGNAAHQLRTPLTTIIGELDLALESPPDTARDETLRARRVAARLSTLIDRLLILARPEESLQVATEVSLLDSVDQALQTLPDAARVRIDCTGEPAHVKADPALLVSAIVSALENALKFSTGRVTIEVTTRGECAVVAIEDTGPGIAERERQQVFTPFYRGQEGRAGHIPGHGIGLAVIARVTAVHGGYARFVDRKVGARLEMS
ncbi:MAG: hypothetical protein RL701_4569, partial [Pseudomonadota bacterium]